MALTKTVTKSAVRQSGMARMWSVSVTLAIADDGPGDGFTRTFSENFKLGNNFAELESRFDADMQKAIDDYKQEQVYFNSTPFSNLVTALESGLEV